VTVRVALDPAARRLDGGRTLLGGDPPRALRLTGGGARELDALARGAVPDTDAARALSRRLLHAGLAHPRHEAASAAAVTVVVPVRDRPRALARCLLAAAAQEPGRIVVVDDGSSDPRAVAVLCAERGAELIRRERPGGPAAARNAALARVDSELVAFVDSDCVGEPGWLALLCGAMAAEPCLGAVGPRVRPRAGADGPGLWAGHPDADGHPAARPDADAGHGSSALSRYAAVRSPLDLGSAPARVHPGGRVAYLPTAALLVRRAALGTGFDEALRHGEDVDFVWRMHDAGWTVRYEPAAVVDHDEPGTVQAWLCRRYRYGSSAGPLARRHPDRLAPVRIHPRPVTILALAAAGRPRTAAAALALHLGLGARTLRRLGVPVPAAVGVGVRGVADSGAALGRAATMLTPAALALGLAHRRTRPAAAALVLSEPLRAYVRTRPSLDPLRFTALALADDVAYGAGVWTGALRARTTRPLRPTRARAAGLNATRPGG
jgi:GT2 family glycosyltransferase